MQPISLIKPILALFLLALVAACSDTSFRKVTKVAQKIELPQNKGNYKFQKSTHNINKASQKIVDYSLAHERIDSTARRNNFGVKAGVRKHYKHAKRQFEKALNFGANDTIRYNLGLTYFQLDELDKALELFQLISKPSNLPNLEHNITVINLLKGIQTDSVLLASPKAKFVNRYAYTNSFLGETSLIKRAARKDCNCLANQRKGYLEGLNGQYEKAIRSAKRATKIPYCEQEAKLNYSMALLGRGKNELAIQHFKGLNKRKVIAEKYLGMGNAKYNLGDLEQAEIYYNKAIALKPDLAKAYVGLGNLALKEKNTGWAKIRYNEALQINPKESTALLGKAICLYDSFLIRIEEIEALISKMREFKYPKEVLLQQYLLHGYAILKSASREEVDKKAIDKAIELLNKARQIDKKEPACLVGLAIAYYNAKDGKKTQQYLDKAIKIEATNPHLFNMKASFYYQDGNYEEARENYHLAYQLDSTNQEVLNGLGIVNRQLEKYVASVFFLNKAVKLSGDDFYHDEYLNNLGLTKYYWAGQLEASFMETQNQTTKDSVILFYHAAVSDIQAAFEVSLELDSTYLLNIGSVVYDSCIGKNNNDSLTNQYYLNGGTRNKAYIANNMGAVAAIKGDISLAKRKFREAITIYRTQNKEEEYLAPIWNLKILGERIGRKERKAIQNLAAERMKNGKDESFRYTHLYHHTYRYQYKLPSRLSNFNEPLFLNTEPEIILDFILMPCTHKKKKPERTKTKRLPKAKRFKLPKGVQCPKFY